MVLSIIGWTGLARIVRGKLISLREEDFVAAARIAGCREMRIINRHLIPSFISYLIVHLTLAIPGMILGETALSFLGLGTAAADGELGRAAAGCDEHPGGGDLPWLLLPVLFVIVFVLCFTFSATGCATQPTLPLTVAQGGSDGVHSPHRRAAAIVRRPRLRGGAQRHRRGRGGAADRRRRPLHGDRGPVHNYYANRYIDMWYDDTLLELATNPRILPLIVQLLSPSIQLTRTHIIYKHPQPRSDDPLYPDGDGRSFRNWHRDLNNFAPNHPIRGTVSIGSATV